MVKKHLRNEKIDLDEIETPTILDNDYNYKFTKKRHEL